MKENNINNNEILNKLPNMEEIAGVFRHKEGCSRAIPLNQTETREIAETEEGPYHLRFGPKFVREVKKYLVCEECHVQERYFD